MPAKNQSIKIVAENRRARHDYHIHETFEAGIVLTGTEIKSLRGGRANLTDSYARIENGELFLISAHISPRRSISGDSPRSSRFRNLTCSGSGTQRQSQPCRA